MFRTKTTPEPVFTDMLKLDLGSVEPSLAGPKRPQDRVLLKDVKAGFAAAMDDEFKKAARNRQARAGARPQARSRPWRRRDRRHHLLHQHVQSERDDRRGLAGAQARPRGLTSKPWVKTSLAPGSQVVGEYLAKSGLQKDLDALGFNLVGFGCTTCIGNSGPLPEEISEAINKNDLVAAAVLSGNRNFEGRVNPDVRANYLASPPLVVAYALAGSMQVDFAKTPLGTDKKGKKVFLKDIWPSSQGDRLLHPQECHQGSCSRRNTPTCSRAMRNWRKIAVKGGMTYKWDSNSTYVQNPPYFSGHAEAPGAARRHRRRARARPVPGFDHDRPHLARGLDQARRSPAGEYLRDHQVRPQDFNQYGTRRGNHEVMMRGTFANIRIKNQMVPGVEGGVTIHYPDKKQMPIYDAAMHYKQEKVPLVVFAGKEYGTGSSRDWAAKGTMLLGVRAVIAQSFERIHRSNLVGMGVLPLVFEEGTSWQTLGTERQTSRSPSAGCTAS